MMLSLDVVHNQTSREISSIKKSSSNKKASSNKELSNQSVSNVEFPSIVPNYSINPAACIQKCSELKRFPGANWNQSFVNINGVCICSFHQ